MAPTPTPTLPNQQVRVPKWLAQTIFGIVLSGLVVSTGRVYARIGSLEGSQRAIEAQIGAVKEQVSDTNTRVQRIESYLMENHRDKGPCLASVSPNKNRALE